MARIVHTADVHLHPDAPERRAALAAVLDRAEEVDANAVTIGGDLFEDATAAERLRPELRSLFSDRPFPVVVIPGNHDRSAFDGDAFFGPAVRPATAEPFERVVLGADGSGKGSTDGTAGETTEADDPAARITCVPYTRELSDDLLVALRERDPVDGLDCLLVHCSLEAPAARSSAGDEDATRYCPVTRGELAALGFDVVLAGHYHGANRVELPGERPADAGTGGTFVYPGTPASVTEAETGRRTVAVVDDAAPQPVRLEPLQTFHYDELRLTVRPREADDAIETVRERVGTWGGRDVDARIAVEGFVDRDESAFAAALDAAAGDVPLENRTRSVAHLLEHPIYREFESHLDAEIARRATESGDDFEDEGDDVEGQGDDVENEGNDVENEAEDVGVLLDDARERVLAAMADLAAEGELS